MQRPWNGPSQPARRRLLDAWRRKEAEYAAELACREVDLEHTLREVRVHRLLGEQPPLDVAEQLARISEECDALTAELVHVRCVLLGLAVESTQPGRPAARAIPPAAAA